VRGPAAGDKYHGAEAGASSRHLSGLFWKTISACLAGNVIIISNDKAQITNETQMSKLDHLNFDIHLTFDFVIVLAFGF